MLFLYSVWTLTNVLTLAVILGDNPTKMVVRDVLDCAPGLEGTAEQSEVE